jgi:hypothetical protein
MNIERANSEPFYRFHRFGEELNRNMRISVAGLALVNQMPAQSQTSMGPRKLFAGINPLMCTRIMYKIPLKKTQKRPVFCMFCSNR